MKRVAILILLCLLNIDAALCQQDSARPADFNFVLEYGSARQLILNTTKATFTRDADLPNLTTSINLKLTAAEMDEVFRGLARIDFWNDAKYPKVFSYPPPIPGQPGWWVVPCGQWLFSVTSRGQVKELSWTDCILEPTFAPADELRAVFKTIDRFITSKPDYKALPPSKATTHLI
jgi:hypothetical protein